jgi:hypothetical protein
MAAAGEDDEHDGGTRDYARGMTASECDHG